MTSFSINTGAFTTEAEAIALAEAAGHVPFALDLTPTGEDHWHDFAATLHVTHGSVKITDCDTGESCELRPGDSLTATRPGVVHREEGDEYRAVVAFHADPSNLSRPIDKAPVDA